MHKRHLTDAASPEIFEPISLGYACDVKYQVSRSLYFRVHPEHSETEFRNMLFRWLRQQTYFTRHIFDWAITPHGAVCAYLEANFKGVFERGDLVIDADGNVHHPELKTIHPHDFTKGPDGRVSEAVLDAEYPAVRRKFEHLAERFRRHLETPGPYLYVMGEIRPHGEVQRLMDLLHARSPEHRFELLLVDKEGAVNQVLHGLSDKASKGWLPAYPPTKPADRLWEGDDDAWGAILNRFPLGLPWLEAASVISQAQPPQGEIERERSVAPPEEAAWRVLVEASGDLLAQGFDYVGDRSAIRPVGEGLGFAGSGPDDHVFTHTLPTGVGAQGGWTRLSATWPAEGARAALIVQDQDCRVVALTDASGDARTWTSIGRLGAEVDHVRIVLLPAAGEGVMPSRISLEVQPTRLTTG